MRSSQVVSGENGSPQQYTALRDDARASSFLLAQQMLGYFTLSTNPSNTQTLTLVINGTSVVFTFVSVIGTAAGNVLIGASAAATTVNLLALLQQPQTTTATGVALSSANIQLVSYLTFAAPSGGATLYVMSNNTTLYAPLTSFSASTTASSDSWTTQTMQLYVHAGTVYVNGTRVLWTGGSTPTVTAPSSHPRIDVLSIDTTGTLAWTTGTESVTPSAPTYPANKVAICELYNVVSETALYDNENQQSGEGYIYNDVRPAIGTSISLGDVQQDILPDADGTRNLGGLSLEWNNIYAKSNIFVNGLAAAIGRYGGNGTDGAISVSSGTTTVSAGNALLLIKNYSGISITGTGKVALSSPNNNGTITLLRNAGNTTLTSSATPMLDGSGMGAAGGAAVTSTTGNPGLPGYGYLYPSNGGTAGTGSSGGIGGAAITASTLANFTFSQYLSRYIGLFVGAGGAGGGTGNVGTTGAGGNGGGCLIVESVGAWNFTTTSGISVAGINGANGASGTAAAGAGGGGGYFLAFVGSITANTGTITISGGSAGSNAGSPGNNYCGGGGGSNVAGSNASAGNSGAGATGVSQVAVNSVFV